MGASGLADVKLEFPLAFSLFTILNITLDS